MEAGPVSKTDVPQEPGASVFFEQGGECLHGFHEVMPGKYFTYSNTKRHQQPFCKDRGCFRLGILGAQETYLE